MSIEIITPQTGSVTISLSYAEAEYLCRAVGFVNAGNLKKHAPELNEVMDALLREYGRNISDEANRYVADIQGGQVYITDLA